MRTSPRMEAPLIQGTSTIATDVLLPSNILRSLATIEADASSHVEAVLHGRLSSEHTSTPLPSPPLTSDLPVETVSPAAATKSQPQSGLGGSGKSRQMIDEFRRKVRRVIRYNFYDIYLPC